jgi:NADPH:quinone reductase-like Zn-dependent oxidoreductase
MYAVHLLQKLSKSSSCIGETRLKQSRCLKTPSLSPFGPPLLPRRRVNICYGMHTAQVTEWGQPPKYLEVDSPPIPAPDSGLVQIKVTAVGLHSVVRSRASGNHFSSGTLPHTVGTDGVGTTSDGQPVYFSTFATGGSFSEIVNVPKGDVTPLPTGIDQAKVAAFVNPGMSSWMALKSRVTKLPQQFCVLIMGATSASGSLAAAFARDLGAKKVIGCARSVDKLSALQLDEVIPLLDPITETDFSHLRDIDVILDYIYGEPAEHLLKSLKSTKPVQYVHIGSLSNKLEISIPGAVIRAKDLTIRGSAPGSFSNQEMKFELPKLLEAMKRIASQVVRVVPLSELETAWNDRGVRTVFVP